jgi:Pheromone A receptor
VRFQYNCAAQEFISAFFIDYIVQDHRFDIVENIGCQAAVYVSAPAIIIIWFPQLFLSALTLIFGGESADSYFFPASFSYLSVSL